MLGRVKRILNKNWTKVSDYWYAIKRDNKLKHIRNSPLKEIIILTVPNTLYIADLLQNSLTQKNIKSKIITKKPNSGYTDNLHIVIAAHSFKTLPSHYIAYQLEQYNSGVFKKPKRVRKLKNALLIIDYSLKNIQYLTNIGFNPEQIYHLPIAQLPLKTSVQIRNTNYDIAFYGDVKNERRQNYLNALNMHFNLHIITNAFASGAIQQLRQAKIVLNIHYYENALLETTRLFECISNGFLVISEQAVDMEEHKQLQGIVDFVETGNIEHMIQRINYWLTHEAERQLQLNKIKMFANQTSTTFEQQFAKVLDYIQPASLN